MSRSPHIAVVGTGAAGMAALAGVLEARRDVEVTVFDVAHDVTPPAHASDEISLPDFYDGVYAIIRKNLPRKFPPPKTHFGRALHTQAIEGGGAAYLSETFGGLTNFWGGTMLPFTSRELTRWPPAAAELPPMYRRVAEIVGVASGPDGLDDYFGCDYATRPPIRPTGLLRRLAEIANRSAGTPGVRIFAGTNRCAIETRPEQPNACVYCGECMAGCVRGSIYSAATSVRTMLADARVQLVRGRVGRVTEDRRIGVTEGDVEQLVGPFDRIILAAGCLGTTEILMRTLSLGRVEIHDNAVFVFPILYLGGLPEHTDNSEEAGNSGRTDSSGGRRDEPHVALTNTIIGCLPRSEDEPFAQAQVYPSFSYLWRYNLTARQWRMVRRLAAWAGRRLLWARLYVHGDFSQSYVARIDNDQLQLTMGRPPRRTDHATRMHAAVRAAISHSGFLVPPIAPILQRANSHYSGTFPYGGSDLPVTASGEVLPGIHLADASVFPETPAINPTFTIMANAMRTGRAVSEDA